MTFVDSCRFFEGSTGLQIVTLKHSFEGGFSFGEVYLETECWPKRGVTVSHAVRLNTGAGRRHGVTAC